MTPTKRQKSTVERSTDHFVEEQLNLHNRFYVGHAVTQGREANRVALLANGAAAGAIVTYLTRANDAPEGLIFALGVFMAGVACSLICYLTTWELIGALAKVGINLEQAKAIDAWSWIARYPLYAALWLFMVGACLSVFAVSSLDRPNEGGTSPDQVVGEAAGN